MSSPFDPQDHPAAPVNESTRSASHLKLVHSISDRAFRQQRKWNRLRWLELCGFINRWPELASELKKDRRAELRELEEKGILEPDPAALLGYRMRKERK